MPLLLQLKFAIIALGEELRFRADQFVYALIDYSASVDNVLYFIKMYIIVSNQINDLPSTY